jgi:hypothetical protein
MAQTQKRASVFNQMGGLSQIEQFMGTGRECARASVGSELLQKMSHSYKGYKGHVAFSERRNFLEIIHCPSPRLGFY